MRRRQASPSPAGERGSSLTGRRPRCALAAARARSPSCRARFSACRLRMYASASTVRAASTRSSSRRGTPPGYGGRGRHFQSRPALCTPSGAAHGGTTAGSGSPSSPSLPQRDLEIIHVVVRPGQGARQRGLRATGRARWMNKTQPN